MPKKRTKAVGTGQFECFRNVEIVQDEPRPLTRSEKIAETKRLKLEAEKAAQAAVEKAKADEEARRRKMVERLNRLTDVTNRIIEDIVSRAGDPWAYHTSEKDGVQFRKGYAIWDDGTVTRDYQELKDGEYRSHSFLPRVDVYGPIDTNRYWTGSLMATLAEEGISTGIQLPCHLLDRQKDGSVGEIAKRFSAFPCDKETAISIRMLLLEYKYESMKILTDRGE